MRSLALLGINHESESPEYSLNITRGDLQTKAKARGQDWRDNTDIKVLTFHMANSSVIHCTKLGITLSTTRCCPLTLPHLSKKPKENKNKPPKTNIYLFLFVCFSTRHRFISSEAESPSPCGREKGAVSKMSLRDSQSGQAQMCNSSQSLRCPTRTPPRQRLDVFSVRSIKP